MQQLTKEQIYETLREVFYKELKPYGIDELGEFGCDIPGTLKTCAEKLAETKSESNGTLLTPEEWLNEGCKKFDWNKLEEGLNDTLWTSNVIIYMKEYAEYYSKTIK